MLWFNLIYHKHLILFNFFIDKLFFRIYKRFGELRKSIGNVSQKVLTSNLRPVEDDGLIKRKVFAEVPPRVEYTLTDTGMSLKPVLDSMEKWGKEYKNKCS